MKILTVVGARPQFIKAANISREIATRTGVSEVIVHTGQHYDANMSDVFFQELSIPEPKYKLGINGKSHGAMTGEMLTRIEEVLVQEKPDVVLVYGDTNSTLAGALAAAKIHIPVAHIEAGLRSFNMRMPEEINRILTDRISTVLYSPSATGVENLRNEGFAGETPEVLRTGDIMYDSVLFYSSQIPTNSRSKFAPPGPFALCTIHREENTNSPERLRSIVEALKSVRKEIEIVLPLHPRTKKLLASHSIATDGLHLIDPVGYIDMIHLLRDCRIVLTDSGGLQKEAYFMGKPCVTVRDETEWVELVQTGHNVLTGADGERIVAGLRRQMAATPNWPRDLYGNGQTAKQIVDHLTSRFGG